MTLLDLQRELEELYRLGSGPSIEQFLISADELRNYLPEGGLIRPQVLVQEVGGSIYLAVYLEESAKTPTNLEDFLTAAEEVSHFLYLSWKGCNERPISLLDLEVQGEIDKYLLASRHVPSKEGLFHRLFEHVRFQDLLSGEALTRYREAHRLGAKFLKTLGGTRPLRLLRDFYRWGSPRRLATISRM